MSLKIAVDEDLPRRAIRTLREQRFLVTADKGFGDIRTYPPGKHFGILLLRPDEDGIRPVVELLEQVVNSYKLEDLVGATTVVTPRGIRMRRA